MTNKKKISFVLPVYNEKEGIEMFFRELTKNVSGFKTSSYDYEFVFINDGSSDGTDLLLKKIVNQDSRVTVLEFSRNFGHQIAISAGMHHASGDAVVIMDVDLQDPPHVCLDLIGEWEKGKEVVFARRRTRKDSFFKKFTARMFYRLLNTVSDIKIPQDTGDFRLLDRKAVEAIKQYTERNRFMRGISAHIGFRQGEVLFDRDERKLGVTHYPFKKMLKFSIDAIMGFSSTPLRLISKIGFVVSGLSLLGILYAIFVKIFYPAITVSGWAFVVVAIFFMGGVQLIMLGIIGGYIARIYSESQNRPLYIISAIHKAENRNK